MVITGVLAQDATTGLINGTPRLQASVIGNDGISVTFTLFGDHRELAQRLPAGTAVSVQGTAVNIRRQWYLNNATLIEQKWIGRLCPVYPGKPRVIKAETVRDRVLELLDTVVDEAATHLLSELDAYGGAQRALEPLGLKPNQIAYVIRAAHQPRDISQGEKAQQALERIVAMQAVARAASARDRHNQAQVFDIDWTRVRARVAALPYGLTKEQRQAAYEIQLDLGHAQPMRRMLSGDVGTGKTVVYGLAAAACVDHGGHVVILAPTVPLAAQIHAELRQWWPDIDVELVAGDAPVRSTTASIRIGTTALLHRDSDTPPSLMIVDEQQKFSRDQREKMTAHGCHLLEVSGTCIPRSMALIRYGALDVSRLTQPHAPKNIASRLWARQEQRALMADIKTSLDAGDQVLVVYPLKEGEGRDSAERAYQLWQNIRPGRVRLVHANLSDEEKKAAVDALKTQQADVLVATTVVEVGISIDGLRHVVVIDPQRLGLTQLHQIRGRAARQGGAGTFSMYPRSELKPEAQERLQVLLDTCDGFEIAERDLALRGYGSLAANADKQTGSDELLYGRSVRLELLDEAAKRLSAAC
ncbi:helicase-related protein [Salinisphaera sp. T31B1]|uniref:helicase-related protein n=1 Tax=Salinisphaera sp. T31B1 TaxID=727963 RepID=UPI0033415553